jgi:UDP-N-acetylmuramate dehydrogenase
VVTEACFGLERGDAAASAARIDEIVSWRREHQPGGQNAGSVFTNPPGSSAGLLVEQVGLKGFRIGSAAVSDKHANFIQADPGGSADDVKRVMDEVRAAVARKLGIELGTELRLIGFGEDQ